jgi:hypothetical protein
MQWIPWEVMIRPKSYGGLGFKDLRLFNQALLSHQAMRLIMNPVSLCSQVLKARYFPQGNLLDMTPAGEASATWRAIEYGVELLKHGAINMIGDGDSTRIWRDNWIPRMPNMRPSRPIRACTLRRVSQLMSQGSNEWDEATLRRYFQPWDVDKILKIKLPTNKILDWVAWQYEKSGVFLVMSAYRLALTRAQNLDEIGSSTTANGEHSVWRKIWKLPVLPKVQNFIWKVTRSGLPTNANRRYRHLTNDASCEMCGAMVEDGYHAVMLCPHAKALRDAMRGVWCLPPKELLRYNGPEWLLTVPDVGKMEEVANLAMVLWRLRTVRNKMTQAQEALSIVGSAEFLMKLENDLKADGGQGLLNENRRKCERAESVWQPPERGAFKVNVDAAFNLTTGDAAVGMIGRDCEGQPHIMAWKLLGTYHDAEEAEVLALPEGLRMAELWLSSTPGGIKCGKGQLGNLGTHPGHQGAGDDARVV